MEESEDVRDGKWTLIQEPAATRAPRHFMRVYGGSYLNKVAHS